MGLSRGAVHSHSAHGMSALQAALETGTSSRVAQVAQVLTAVRALDREVADQILDDFVLALGARRAGAAGQRGPDPRPLMRSPVAHLPLGMLMNCPPPAAGRRAATGASTAAACGPGPAGAHAVPVRVIPLGQVIPVRGGDLSGEMHLLSYSRTGPVRGSRSSRERTANSCRRGSSTTACTSPSPSSRCTSSPQETTTAPATRWASAAAAATSHRAGREITLDPAPPPGIRWLDLTTTPGGSAVRIDLNRPPGDVGVTVRPAGTSPGEHLLHHMQPGCSCSPWPSRTRSGFTRPCQHPSRSPASPTGSATP